MKKLFQLIFVFSLYTLYFILNVALVNAQTVSLSISPSVTQIVAKPGKPAVIKYMIENHGDPTIIFASVLPFEPIGILGETRMKETLDGPFDFRLLNENLDLGQALFLKNNETTELNLEVSSTQDAFQGDYYYDLYVWTQPQGQSEGSVSVKSRVSLISHILITLTKNGNTETKAKISIFDLASSLKFMGKKINIFDSQETIPIKLVVENRGKNLIIPRGEIIIRDMLGRSTRYELSQVHILSQSQRLIKAESSKQIESTLALKGFYLGYYNLSTNINFGKGSSILFASTSFTAIPTKFIIRFGIILIVLLILLKILSPVKEKP